MAIIGTIQIPIKITYTADTGDVIADTGYYRVREHDRPEENEQAIIKKIQVLNGIIPRIGEE